MVGFERELFEEDIVGIDEDDAVPFWILVFELTFGIFEAENFVSYLWVDEMVVGVEGFPF